jgi:hypothetical protein
MVARQVLLVDPPHNTDACDLSDSQGDDLRLRTSNFSVSARIGIGKS